MENRFTWNEQNKKSLNRFVELWWKIIIQNSNTETKSGNFAHSFNKNKQKFRHKFIPRALIFRLSLFQLIYQRITTRPPNIPQWFIFVLFSQFWQYKTCDKIHNLQIYTLYVALVHLTAIVAYIWIDILSMLKINWKTIQ